MSRWGHGRQRISAPGKGGPGGAIDIENPPLLGSHLEECSVRERVYRPIPLRGSAQRRASIPMRIYRPTW